MNLNAKKTAFLFPGQGSQVLGMGRELAAAYPAARRTFEEADRILGFSLSEIMWRNEDELNDTANTQPALFLHSIAAWRVFCEYAPEFEPAFLSGHSLGELTALVVAGSLSFDDGLRLVRRRGELMRSAGERAPGGMAAILGLSVPVLEEICAKVGKGDDAVQVANDNCPGQVVISGAKPALARAIDLAKEAGARRAIPLAVSIAPHSALMAAIQRDFDEVLEHVEIRKASRKVVGNVGAKPLSSEADIRADLRAQLTSRVRWTESIRWMIGAGVESFVELGSKNVLTGLLKRIDRKVKGFSLGEAQDFESFFG